MSKPFPWVRRPTDNEMYELRLGRCQFGISNINNKYWSLVEWSSYISGPNSTIIFRGDWDEANEYLRQHINIIRDLIIKDVADGIALLECL